jgi:uncharacterized protein DUF1488
MNSPGTTMALSFPNQSRSYDVTRRVVRFGGYDSAMESSFLVTEDALKRVQPDIQFDETGSLHAFDSNRSLIYAAAAKPLRVARKALYVMGKADFR